VKRGPLKKLVPLRQTLSEITGPLFSDIKLASGENDLTRNADTGKEALGERIIVVGRVLDEDDKPVPPDRNLAGQRRRSLSSRGGSAPRAAGS
jgi:protocatechuate 3,4-dioxygenase beta subunit